MPASMRISAVWDRASFDPFALIGRTVTPLVRIVWTTPIPSPSFSTPIHGKSHWRYIRTATDTDSGISIISRD